MLLYLHWLLKDLREQVWNRQHWVKAQMQFKTFTKMLINTFPSCLGWTWKYWVTKYNFIKFHLNIWLTLDAYPFPSGQHQETCYFFSKYRNFSVWKRNLFTLRSLIHAALCVMAWWGVPWRLMAYLHYCTFPQFSFIWFVTFSFKLEFSILKCGLLKNTINIFKNSEF